MGMQSTTRTRVVAYVRVSTDKQADKGVSLDAQREKVVAYATLYDLDVVEVVVDAGASAKSLEREGLQRALGMLTDGAADALLVVKLDRLTRSVADLATLIDAYFAAGKYALLSVSEQIDTRSAAGRLVLNVLASVSQWEREAIGERTSVAMQHIAAQGRHVGGTARYGYRLSACGQAKSVCTKAGGCGLAEEDHGELVKDDAEQATIAAARELRERGLTMRDVAIELAKAGWYARNGERFLPAQVKRMVED